MTDVVSRRAMLELSVLVGKPVDFGQVAGQGRRFVPILGGTVSGDFEGSIIPGGADWQTVGPNGMLQLEARYALLLGDATVEIRADGLRSGSPEVLAKLATGALLPASDYYFRTAMRFYTSSPELAHLNSLMAIGVGERLPSQVRISVHRVL
jgi:Protein of unknown function (DUF3237)